MMGLRPLSRIALQFWTPPQKAKHSHMSVGHSMVMQTECPKCGVKFTIGLTPLEAMNIRIAIKDERDVAITKEQAIADVEVERMKRQQRVAKEARQTCAELAKARKDAQRAISKNHEAAQYGVSITPALTTTLQALVAKLIDAERYSGALS